MSYNAKNYFAHGGSDLVIGGKLTFLPGAVVEGGEGLFDIAPGDTPVLSYLPDSEATTVAALKESFNELLAALREAGIMAATSESSDPTENDTPGEAP